jgi:hypothetical protein
MRTLYDELMDEQAERLLDDRETDEDRNYLLWFAWPQHVRTALAHGDEQAAYNYADSVAQRIEMRGGITVALHIPPIGSGQC